MNQHTNTNLVLRSGLAIALALTLWSPVQAQSADPAEEKTKMEEDDDGDRNDAVLP